MKRCTSLLLTAFVLVLLAAAGSVYLSGYADKTEQDKTLPVLTVYTTLPAEHAALLSAEYEKTNKVRVSFVPLTAADMIARLKDEAGKPKADMLLADSQVLRQAAAAGVLEPYVSETADSVSEEFRDASGQWNGVWYDPVIFCANADYLRSLPRIPETWSDLAGYHGVRIGITDFLASEASANLYFSLLAQYGEPTVFQLLRQLHPKVVQYAKYLSTPVRMAGMDEVDVSIAVQSETLRYIHEGYPLKIIYPVDGTAYMLTGTGILKNAPQAALARNFADWLLGDEAQLVLQKNSFFFVPVNPATLAYKTFAGKNIILFSQQADYSAQQRHDLLDRWVKNIRIK